MNMVFDQTAILYVIISGLVSGSFSWSGGAGCQLARLEVMGVVHPGDILIGTILPVHNGKTFPSSTFTEKPTQIICQRFGLLNYQYIQAMLFAVDEINKKPDFLPNVTLGFWIYDSCSALQRALEGTMGLLTQKKEPVPNFQCQRSAKLAGIIGEFSSTFSMIMARILGPQRYPQISFFSTIPLLSDRNQFPSFFRTIPSDDFQSRGLAQLVIYFGWTWVGLLAIDTDYGQQGIQTVQQKLLKAGVCIAFSEYILTSVAHRNALHITQVIKQSSANAIVMFANEANIVPLMDEMVKHNITGKTWISTEAWATSKLLAINKYWGVLTGTIGFAIHSGEMPGFKQYLHSIRPSKFIEDALIITFWEAAFGCKLINEKDQLNMLDNTTKLCTGEEQLDSLEISYNDVSALRSTYLAYKSVYAMASALKDLQACMRGKGPFYRGTCSDIKHFQPWQLLHYVQNVHVRNADGTELSFDKQGNAPALYDVVNWQMSPEGTIKFVKVGMYDSSASQILTFNMSAIVWSSGKSQIPVSVCSPSCSAGFWKATKPGEPSCCFQCVPCPQGEISNQTDAVVCTKCPWDQWPTELQTRCIQKSMDFLSFDETLGLILAVVSIILSFVPSAILVLFNNYRDTPIVKANNRFLSYLLLLALSFCFLCSLVFIGFPGPEKCLLRQAAFGIIFAMCVSCVLAKTIMVVIAFKAIHPNNDLKRWIGPQFSYIVVSVGTFIQVLLCVIWLLVSPPYSQYNIYTQPGKITVECNEGSTIAFWCMLGYLGLLATISFIVAFLARTLPDSFNEAKFITFSMLAFLSVWLSFIPAYLSTKGKYMVAMEIFAILSSSFALLSCIFFPKCYIILLRPEMNTREVVMGR